MITRQQTRYGWQFLFLGANIDAVETAAHYGIPAENAVDYHADSDGTALNFRVVGEAMCCMRESGRL